MFGVITTPRGSPATPRRPDLDRAIPFPRLDTTGAADLGGPAPKSRRSGTDVADPSPGLKLLEPKPRGARKADLERGRRIFEADLTYIAHPSFDDAGARDALLAPATGYESPGRDSTLAGRDRDGDLSPQGRFPNREREAHAFRKLNYLKFLACRIRDGIDPDSPARGELDEVERLQAEAQRLRNRIVETHLPLVVSVAQKRSRIGYDLSDRVGDGTLAMINAVDRFDFARGNRFTTYAAWAIINELVRFDRKLRHRSGRAVARDEDHLATGEPESERYEREEAQDRCRTAVDRLLSRLDWRERRILRHRHGIGGVAELSLMQIGRDLGISKERVRQIEQRAHAKLRSLAELEAIGPSSL